VETVTSLHPRTPAEGSARATSAAVHGLSSSSSSSPTGAKVVTIRRVLPGNMPQSTDMSRKVSWSSLSSSNIPASKSGFTTLGGGIPGLKSSSGGSPCSCKCSSKARIIRGSSGVAVAVGVAVFHAAARAASSRSSRPKVSAMTFYTGCIAAASGLASIETSSCFDRK
jgi:hypothetical protein